MASETAETIFRRPTADDALALARDQFLAGERVEMGALAAQLGINRTTLYRWVGEREQLMGTLFSALIDEWLEAVRAERDYAGVEGFLDILRGVLELGAEFEPLTEFTRREPALAMRVLSDRSGAVAANADATISRLLSEVAPEVDPPESVIRAISVVSRTLVWANIATDQEPDVDGVIDLSRTVLESSPRR
ncbi:MAG: QsdR family transcriptional regulator [Solirubrobacterales bacterium]